MGRAAHTTPLTLLCCPRELCLHSSSSPALLTPLRFWLLPKCLLWQSTEAAWGNLSRQCENLCFQKHFRNQTSHLLNIKTLLWYFLFLGYCLVNVRLALALSLLTVSVLPASYTLTLIKIVTLPNAKVSLKCAARGNTFSSHFFLRSCDPLTEIFLRACSATGAVLISEDTAVKKIKSGKAPVHTSFHFHMCFISGSGR